MCSQYFGNAAVYERSKGNVCYGRVAADFAAASLAMAAEHFVGGVYGPFYRIAARFLAISVRIAEKYRAMPRTAATSSLQVMI